jgi:LicD family
MLLKQFASTTNDSERSVMATMLGRLTDTLDASNLTYHICGGALIGSYRHHGMVPWDDDIDIYVRWNERDLLEAAIQRNLSKEYVLEKFKTKPLWKLFHRHQSAAISGRSWNYPFVDIFFMSENSTMVWEQGNRIRWYRRSTVYPLRRRPFMGMWLWAPNDTETYLKTTINIDKCNTNKYIHKIEKFSKKVYSVDCRRLWPHYPFVFRSKVTPVPADRNAKSVEVVVEDLRLGDRVISTVAIIQL